MWQRDLFNPTRMECLKCGETLDLGAKKNASQDYCKGVRETTDPHIVKSTPKFKDDYEASRAKAIMDGMHKKGNDEYRREKKKDQRTP